MAKYVFWSVLYRHTNVALTENLSHYALGSTFWQAMDNLAGLLKEWGRATSPEETSVGRRLMMYNETGINRIEIFVNGEQGKFSVRCANSSSLVEAGSEEAALRKYISARARTSVVNTGQGSNE